MRENRPILRQQISNIHKSLSCHTHKSKGFMMGDHHRFGQNTNNHQRDNSHQFDAAAATPNRADLFLRSESPRIQQILLHQKLKEDIEKNSAGRVRYVDSELYLRNNNNNHEGSFNQASSEIQIATLNIGSNKQTQSSTINHNNKVSSSSGAKASIASSSSTTGLNKRPSYDLKSELELCKNQQAKEENKTNKNCKVCQIKEVRQELMNINKIVQDRNEQITKLKAKCLRSYFERQMI